MPVKISNLVKKNQENPNIETFQKVKKAIPSAFVTLMQAVSSLRTLAFNSGQQNLHTQIEDIEKEINGLYKTLEKIQQQLHKVVK